ncbi:hypothetical protein LTR53_019090, partial [Teratosphaeriaceae sp. CCFEE 6253]
MDLDRAEQETRGLKTLLQEHDVLTSSRPTSRARGADDNDGPSGNGSNFDFGTARRQRDQARQAAEDFRHRAGVARNGSSEELMHSAQRMDELADQLQQQMEANLHLRDRLADAVVKGEREQEDSTKQIEEMQMRLAGMEDSVLVAQQHSETMLGNHESDVRRIEETTSPS